MSEYTGEYTFEPIFREAAVVYTNIHSFFVENGIVYGIYPDGSMMSMGTMYASFYCDTAAGSNPKIVSQDSSLENYKRLKISEGVWFLVRFKYTNTNSQPQLMVNNKGPYRIYYRGKPVNNQYLQKDIYYMMVLEKDPATGSFVYNIVGNVETGRKENTVVGTGSYAQGNNLIASGDYSHAEGDNTEARAKSSHAEGLGTVATSEAQHAQGKFNVIDDNENYIDIVGNGTDVERSNAFALDAEGNGRYLGNLYVETEADSSGGKKVATEEYVQYHSDALIYKGVVHSNNDLPARHERGWTYKVGTDGTYGTHICEVGDIIICNTDGTVKNDAHWDAVQAGDGSVVGPANVTDSAIALFDGTNGKVIKNSIATLTANGALSIGRKTNTTLAAKSVAIGTSVEASGNNSHAEGQATVASAINSHAEGLETISSGANSHAEGNGTTASGESSHAEGNSTNATAANSHAEGLNTDATEEQAHAEGNDTLASGINSHAEGNTTIASAINSHSEGLNSQATAAQAHAEGSGTVASGSTSHTEGNLTQASGANAHAEGNTTSAIGNNTHSEGLSSIANGLNSHAEGNQTTTYGETSHAEGYNTTTGEENTIKGKYAHAEGNSTLATGESAHAEGNNTTASGNNAHTEGVSSTASGTASHAEGGETEASGLRSHAEGNSTIANGSYSHAEGSVSHAYGETSHAEGYQTRTGEENTLKGKYSHSEGRSTIATGEASHAEGYNTDASANYAHTEGQDTIANAVNAHAEGLSSTASGTQSHSEGYSTTAQGANSHAEGNTTSSSGTDAHSEGNNTTASGDNSHSEGLFTVANHKSQHVSGEYNVADPSLEDSSSRGNYVEIVGNGTSSAHSNAYALEWNGTGHYKGDLYVESSADSTTGKKVATEEYVQHRSNAFIYKDIINSDNDLPNEHERGWAYKVATEGTYAGHICEVGDFIVCNTDGSIKNDSHWDAIQAGDKSVISSTTTSVNGRIAVYDGTTGKIIKQTTVTVDSTKSNALSSGRSGNVGSASIAYGLSVAATGEGSVAVGYSTQATANYAHAEGVSVIASGIASHAEGNTTQANGETSHAEGYNTVAAKKYQHVFGKNNSYSAEDTSTPTQEGTYIELVGNGADNAHRSNARALDWSGNERINGKLYVDCNADSSGGYEVATLLSPALTGIPTAPTAETSTENTQIATTEYVKNKINSMLDVADAMMFKGTLGENGTTTSLPTVHEAGWTYKVVNAGTYAGHICEIGDLVICINDNTVASNADWTAVQTNMDGIVIGPVSSTDGHVALFDGNTGKSLKDSGTIQSLIIDDTAGTSITDKVWSADKATNQLALKVDKTITINGHALDSNVTVTKGDVGLGNCDNTSDANKPISTATQEALDTKVPNTRTINGHTLDSNVTITKSDVNLGNCNNTSDTDKPISNATQTALDAKAPLASPILTGVPKSVTPSNDSDSKMIATKEYVDAVTTDLNTRIPTPPDIDGEYTLKCIVAEGEATYSWVEIIPEPEG